VDVAQKVLAALAGPPPADAGDAQAGWTALAPGQGSEVIRVRDRATGLHPLGAVRLSQTVAPLDIALDRFGTNPVSGPNPVSLAVASGGLASSPVAESFPRAQYFNLSDDERLSKAAFVDLASGVVVQDLAWRVGPTISVDVVYEEEIGDPVPDRTRWFTTIDVAVFEWNHVGAAGVAHLSELHEPSPLGIGVREPAFTAAPSGTGPAAGASFGTAADVLGISIVKDADVAVFADYEAELMHR
jgi:hypothetical protein